MKIELWVALIGLAGTLLGVWLGSRGSIKTAHAVAEIEKHKHARDRLWDSRKDAYTAMTATLTELARHAETHVFWFGEFGTEGYFLGDALYDANSKEMGDLHESFRTQIEKATLICSQAFLERAKQLQTELDMPGSDDPPKRARREADAFRRAASDLLAIAKSEIAPMESEVESGRQSPKNK